MIELAYQVAEAYGIPFWCQDEAGPSATRPQPGSSWQPIGKAKWQPHEYVRDGGAKLMTLFRPATGELRAKGVRAVTNAVLHPWLQEELVQVLPCEQAMQNEHPARMRDPEQRVLTQQYQRWETWLVIAMIPCVVGSLSMASCLSTRPFPAPG